MAQSIDAQKLKIQFIEATTRGTLCSVSELDRLANIASSSVKQLTGPQQVVAYVIRAFFRAVVYDYDERAVSQTEIKALQEQLHQPIIEAIEYLSDSEPEVGKAVHLCEGIIKTHLNHLPFG